MKISCSFVHEWSIHTNRSFWSLLSTSSFTVLHSARYESESVMRHYNAAVFASRRVREERQFWSVLQLQITGASRHTICTAETIDTLVNYIHLTLNEIWCASFETSLCSILGQLIHSSDRVEQVTMSFAGTGRGTQCVSFPFLSDSKLMHRATF